MPIKGSYSINIIVNDFVNHLSFIGEKEVIVNDDNYLSDLFLFYKKPPKSQRIHQTIKLNIIVNT